MIPFLFLTASLMLPFCQVNILPSDREHYLCSHFGFLFSTKAVIPSFLSFVPNDACKHFEIGNVHQFRGVFPPPPPIYQFGDGELGGKVFLKKINSAPFLFCWGGREEKYLEHPFLKPKSLPKSEFCGSIGGFLCNRHGNLGSESE